MQTLLNFNIRARHYSCNTLLRLEPIIYISEISKMHSNTQVPTIFRRNRYGNVLRLRPKEIDCLINENI